MSAAPGLGLGEVIRQLSRQGAGGFEWYKESCLLRRVEVRMRARGVGTLTGYAGLLADEPEEMERLLRSLSVRVTGFFRNPDTWIRLRELLPPGLSGFAGRFSAWSMGCSTGEEAWSLALLLDAAVRRGGGVGQPDQIRVCASDVDAQALTIAEAGLYPAAAAAPPIREVLGFDLDASGPDGRVEVPARLRPLLRFRREDLTAAAGSPEWHDLICCRNVLIFLGREGQRRVLQAAAQALRPGGLLVLGRTESLLALPQSDLLPADTMHRIYRKAP